MKCGSDLRDTLKSAIGDYLSITLITGKTYYGEVKKGGDRLPQP